jgi:hypothetical protein
MDAAFSGDIVSTAGNSGKNTNENYNNAGGKAYCRYIWGTLTVGSGFIDLMPGGGSPAGISAYYYPDSGIQATFPYQILLGTQFTISWAIRNDQGQVLPNVSVTLQQKLDNGNYTTVYTGTNTSYAASITYSGNETVTFKLIVGDQSVTSHAIALIDSGATVPPSAPYNLKVTTVGHEVDGVDDETTVTSGEYLNISWEVDFKSNFINYELQWKGNSGSWETIYSGPNTEAIDDVPDVFDSIQYRVRAININTQVASNWVTGNTITVEHNKRPQISGIDRILGTFDETPPEYTYSITDNESDLIMASLWIDGTKIVEFIPELGLTYSYTINELDWQHVSNGVHIIQVLAVDQLGRVANRTVQYTKGVSRIEFVTSPHNTTDIPSMLRLSFIGYIPEGADLLVEATNNAFDDEPVWEDITSYVANSSTYNFQNSRKTAQNWGISIRLKIRRLTGIGLCYIKGLSGKYTVGVQQEKIQDLEERIEALEAALANV